MSVRLAVLLGAVSLAAYGVAAAVLGARGWVNDLLDGAWR